MVMKLKRLQLITVTAGLLVASCGGGGGSSTPSTTDGSSIADPAPVTTPSSTPTPTAASKVSMTVGSKVLNFSWVAGNNVDHYRILVNPDGVSGFTVVSAASNISSAATSYSLEIPVHKTNWLASQYILEACDAAESSCASSPNQAVALIDSVAATVYVKASNAGWGDGFGVSVALSGDGNTLAVGASGEASAAAGTGGNQADNTVLGSGAVYVFTRTGSTWAQQAYIKASNTEGNDSFGGSVTLSDDGNTLAVGASGEASAAIGVGGNQFDNTAANSGAVYVFTRTGSTWTQQAYIKASNTEAFDGFGTVTLSGDGNTLAVSSSAEASAAAGIGGNQANNTAPYAGAVYVFSRTGSTWTQQAYLKASNTEAFDAFGTVTLSGDGNTLAVGAPSEDSAATGVGGNQADNTAVNSGAVYVFTRTGVSWVQQAYVKAPNTGASDNFGSSVAISSDGNTLAVVALGEASAAAGIGGNQADNTAANSGAVYVFSRTGSTWTQQAYIKASNTEAADWFGSSVALSGDGNTLAVGALAEASAAAGIGGNQADNTAANSGAVYVFSRTGSTWTQQAYIKASNTEAADQFGFSVAISDDGNTLAVGADGEASADFGINGNQTNNLAFNAGAVYLY